jgi:hypothetical protein
MLIILLYVLLGGYIGVALLSFLIVGFFSILVGKSRDLWKPFFYGIFWPIGLFVLFSNKKYY